MYDFTMTKNHFILIIFLFILEFVFRFHKKSNGCTDMDQPTLAVYKLTEKYFINTIFDQLKAYIMLQLSYLTRATKVQF